LKAESVYGRTKVMCERILMDVCVAEAEWKVISLRYFNPAGAHPSGLIGEDPVGRPGNLLPLLAHMAVGAVKDSVLKVFGNDYPTKDGTCVRDYLHVMDLAQGHVLALEPLSSSPTSIFGPSSIPYTPTPAEKVLNGGGKYKAYNLGKGAGMSVFDIVHAMEKATSRTFQTEVIGRRVGDVPELIADPALAERELGFKATRDLEEMCEDLWRWQSRNPKGYLDDEVKGGAGGVNGTR